MKSPAPSDFVSIYSAYSALAITGGNASLNSGLPPMNDSSLIDCKL